MRYALEVAAHLVWTYVVLTGLWLVLMFVFFAVMAGGKVGPAFESVKALASHFAFMFGLIHVLTFLWFRTYFWPRFPDAPAMLTFSIAAIFGSLLLALVWSFNGYQPPSSSNVFVDMLGTLFADRSFLLDRFLTSLVVTIGAAGFSQLAASIGAPQAAFWGPGLWLGRLLVGREAYDAHAAREAAKLKRDYNDYVDVLRRSERIKDH